MHPSQNDTIVIARDLQDSQVWHIFDEPGRPLCNVPLFAAKPGAVPLAFQVAVLPMDTCKNCRRVWVATRRPTTNTVTS